MRVTVNREVCTGHALCVAVAGNVFDIDDSGIAAVLHEEVPEHLQAEARDAIAACPEQAITVLP